MTPETVMTIATNAMKMTLILSGPLLLVALAAGLIVSLFQAATQINEMTLSFIPKLLALFITMVLIGPWMINTFVDYMREVFESIPGLAH
ncbi:flagellar biosynthesis protein FliQ [Cupriavidus respiraculi]|uniref:Flagellar biosynthetic protein FliQ n=1 Tax=Cupriavidus respiraculi TaxID=195930 RepID=A0ABM8XHW5_9BURK|nr:flagellar biosynthesis protein FliQ [Cupriavidus respiraculi]CAG9179776.1 Flagellar biosynthetic protein FliQ [Cupriavidus respiraculi]